MDGEDELVGASVPQILGILGGPYDTSLLVKYEHHVARYLWFNEVSKWQSLYFE